MDKESYGNGDRTLLTIPQCETCENFIRGDFLHCKCYEWELSFQDTENKAESVVERADAKKNAAPAYSAKYYKWVWCCVALSALLLIGWIGYAAYRFYSLPRFHDLTVELGTENISVEAFMTEFANARHVGIVTDLSTVDIGVVGSIPLTLRCGRKDETVTLTIEDTTPPEAEFIPYLEKTPDYLPDPHDFVASYFDLSDITVYFAETSESPSGFDDQCFTVVVEDACGNAVSGQCTLSTIWMKNEYTLELGETLCKDDILYPSKRDDYQIKQHDIDIINNSGIGDYAVSSLVNEDVCQVHVVDTVPPELIVTDISIYKGEKVTVDDFVESCSDLSGEVEVCLVTEPDVDTLGKQSITIEATDGSGNITTATSTLAVVRDKKPPVIKGLTTLSTAKNTAPDYLAGVRAIDRADGTCEVTFDASGVDLSTAGTYYVTYTSKDKDGNVATSRRTIVVGHDQADTDALVDSIAAGLGSDPEAIRDYVRNTIKYSHNDGGADPVWYGFTNKSGNCLVHALCLQSLLTRKGYETQLIWVTNKSHYWLIIHLNGVWRHIDATPGNWHTKYSLMTDEQRYSILQGRNWDRSAWPACE